MFKKTLLVGAIALAASGIALADGFYVGAGLGGTGFHDKTSFNGDGLSLGNDQGNLGVIGGLDAGYTFNFPSQFNLGLEVFSNATSAKVTNTVGSYETSEKLRYNYGFRVLPGYQVTPDTDFHGIVGFARANVKFDAGTAGNETKNYNGFQLGFGSGTNVAKNVGVRGDVIYTGYQSKTYTGTDGDTFKTKINTLDGVVSVQYKFG